MIVWPVDEMEHLSDCYFMLDTSFAARMPEIASLLSLWPSPGHPVLLADGLWWEGEGSPRKTPQRRNIYAPFVILKKVPFLVVHRNLVCSVKWALLCPGDFGI